MPNATHLGPCDYASMIGGLGFVLSFGCRFTAFLVVERAMAANLMDATLRTRLITAVPKMLVPALVILPGMIATALHASSGGTFLPPGADGHPPRVIAESSIRQAADPRP